MDGRSACTFPAAPRVVHMAIDSTIGSQPALPPVLHNRKWDQNSSHAGGRQVGVGRHLEHRLAGGAGWLDGQPQGAGIWRGWGGAEAEGGQAAGEVGTCASPRLDYMWQGSPECTHARFVQHRPPSLAQPTPLQLLPALTKWHGVGGGRGPEEQRLGDRLLGGVLDAQGLALHNGVAAADDDGAGAAEQVGLRQGASRLGGAWMGELTGRQGWHVQRSRVCAVV